MNYTAIVLYNKIKSNQKFDLIEQGPTSLKAKLQRQVNVIFPTNSDMAGP